MTKEEFKAKRLSLGLSQPQLAEQMGLSVRAIQSIEQGWRGILPHHVSALKKAKPHSGESTLNRRRKHTDEELKEIDGFIRKNHKTMGISDMAKQLGEKPKYINERTSKLKTRGELG